MNRGKLYLIPSPLGENEISEVIPSYVTDILNQISFFCVEELRTARRYLSASGLKGRIGELTFFELNEHTEPSSVEKYLTPLLEGNHMALISEAGLPAVADPGALLVELAHKHDIEVVPMVGPSSLFLSLMASGMNGQRFSFLGYLPVKSDERKKRLKEIEKRSAANSETQIFIETPYRNDSLFADILAVCANTTKICVAADITLSTSFIKTKTVADWKTYGLQIGKRPCVFLLLS